MERFLTPELPYQCNRSAIQKPSRLIVPAVAGINLAGFRLTVPCRVDTPVEIEYYRNGGVLRTVLRKPLKA